MGASGSSVEMTTEQKQSLLDRCLQQLKQYPWDVELRRQIIQLSEELGVECELPMRDPIQKFRLLYEAYVKEHANELEDGSMIVFTDEHSPPVVYTSVAMAYPYISGRRLHRFMYYKSPTHTESNLSLQTD